MQNNYLIRVKHLVERKNHPLTDEEKTIEQQEVSILKELQIKNKTIALIEPNSFHSECFISYVKLFLDAGFDVHLFATKKNLTEGPLDNNKALIDKIKIFSFSKFPTCEEFFKHLCKYQYVLLLTLLCQDRFYYAEYLNENFIKKYNKNNVFCINHEINLFEINKPIEDVFKNKTFVLRPNIFDEGKELPFLSPTYFGEFENAIKPLNSKKKFLCIGGNYMNGLRNYEELYEAINKLLKNNINNFEITFIGNNQEQIKENITNEISPYVKCLGRLDFPSLYKQIIDCDYLLFNITPDTIRYEKYLKTGISGSYSTSIGFLKPAIIETNLAKAYNLKDSSFMYDVGNLYETLKDAINISEIEYANKQNNLKNLKENLYAQSLLNIKEYFNA